MKYALIALGALLLIPAMPASEASAHGCHRSVERGPAGWHRHVGRNCARVAAGGPRAYGRGNRCVERCRYIGPIKQCSRVC